MRHSPPPPRSTPRLGVVPGLASSLLACLLLAFCLALPSTAMATTVLKMDLEDLVEASDNVVVGQVVAQEAVLEDGKVFTVTTIQVDEELKGPPRAGMEAITLTIKQIGGRTDELVTRVPGMPSFEIGEEVLVFAEKPEKFSHFVVTGLSQGKFHVALGPDNATKVVVPRLGDMSLVERSQAITQSVPDQPVGTLRPVAPSTLHRGVVPLDEFKTQIREIIQRADAQPTTPSTK